MRCNVEKYYWVVLGSIVSIACWIEEYDYKAKKKTLGSIEKKVFRWAHRIVWSRRRMKKQFTSKSFIRTKPLKGIKKLKRLRVFEKKRQCLLWIFPHFSNHFRSVLALSDTENVVSSILFLQLLYVIPYRSLASPTTRNVQVNVVMMKAFSTVDDCLSRFTISIHIVRQFCSGFNWPGDLMLEVIQVCTVRDVFLLFCVPIHFAFSELTSSHIVFLFVLDTRPCCRKIYSVFVGTGTTFL